MIASHRRQNYSSIEKCIKACVEKGAMETYKWYSVLSQLTSRIVHDNLDTVQIIVSIIAELAAKYPELILYSIYSQIQSTSSNRAKRGKKIFEKLINSKDKNLISGQVYSAFSLLEALTGICKIEIPKRKTRMHLFNDLKFSYPRGEECLSLALPIIFNFEQLYQACAPSSKVKYKMERLVTFSSFESRVQILSSMQKPKRLFIIGSDGRRYSIMCKKDDLRKDAKVLEFIAVVNRLLAANSESERRKLSITTYAAIPLNETIGLIEWVDNSRTLRDIFLTYYSRQGNSVDFGKAREMLDQATQSQTQQYVNFIQLTKKYQPVLPTWFIDQFPNPAIWYYARNLYVRSCAVMSFVGYLVGLGDRHGDNIMVNEKTGGVMHVDFDCLFDKGKKLAVPERVPFRLTRNMIAAMGVTGIEGVFRRTSEVTMELIRGNENILMNVLETFLLKVFWIQKI
ncbi:unnamed protein product [Ambrosiozyma monospora]|uniref:Unnamed protein product n=1 Tax=Ambrosiozyma monospora TaxID=43982 RepID=A0ACB5TVH4_AMBMO|nr:unnamed protein product [Ambrosiozyma monospora]